LRSIIGSPPEVILAPTFCLVPILAAPVDVAPTCFPRPDFPDSDFEAAAFFDVGRVVSDRFSPLPEAFPAAASLPSLVPLPLVAESASLFVPAIFSAGVSFDRTFAPPDDPVFNFAVLSVEDTVSVAVPSGAESGTGAGSPKSPFPADPVRAALEAAAFAGAPEPVAPEAESGTLGARVVSCEVLESGISREELSCARASPDLPRAASALAAASLSEVLAVVSPALASGAVSVAGVLNVLAGLSGCSLISCRINVISSASEAQSEAFRQWLRRDTTSGSKILRSFTP
jgi:hypothetical protein